VVGVVQDRKLWRKAAAEYQDIFGKNKYFRDGLLEIAKKLGAPPLVTNDSHYTYAHDTLLCIQTGKNLSDPDRFKFDGTGYYLKSTDEMYAIDSSDAWHVEVERRRVEVIRYVTETYGADKVAMIGTYGTIKAKNAIKDSARLLGYPYAMGDRITKATPPGSPGWRPCPCPVRPWYVSRQCGRVSRP
jgi:DNA polymerase III alpha subunit